jgi:hypothetical protein
MTTAGGAAGRSGSWSTSTALCSPTFARCAIGLRRTPPRSRPGTPQLRANGGLLIGCERLGLLTTTATNRAARAWPELKDPGRYIIEFIETYFPRKHPFKRISKILADAMRHELVHGFGGRRSSAPFELALYVSADKGRFYEVRERRRRRPLLTINSVAFADAVLGAAGDIRRRMDREPCLVERILSGAAARFKTPEGVLAEWEHRVRRGSQTAV